MQSLGVSSLQREKSFEAWYNLMWSKWRVFTMRVIPIICFLCLSMSSFSSSLDALLIAAFKAHPCLSKGKHTAARGLQGCVTWPRSHECSTTPAISRTSKWYCCVVKTWVIEKYFIGGQPFHSPEQVFAPRRLLLISSWWFVLCAGEISSLLILFQTSSHFSSYLLTNLGGVMAAASALSLVVQPLCWIIPNILKWYVLSFEYSLLDALLWYDSASIWTTDFPHS